MNSKPGRQHRREQAPGPLEADREQVALPVTYQPPQMTCAGEVLRPMVRGSGTPNRSDLFGASCTANGTDVPNSDPRCS